MKYISIDQLQSVREIQLVFQCGAGIRCYNKYCRTYDELKELQLLVKTKIQCSKNEYVVDWYSKLDNQLNKFTL